MANASVAIIGANLASGRAVELSPVGLLAGAAGRHLVADRFRVWRLLICGATAHICVPFAGCGMNAGLVNTASLASELPGVLPG
ncbi:FAD-dependent monooxygenase [Novosphingobium sp. Gsoil 351]|uniref:FAD-dependent monooxygenase n=1 Tax=Novosphingobium sp. Gsoil 351 TaxID=2675225 RepID=UPI0012B4FC33|nr:hypothetical protein GKE62_05050 [Novosphingobium sp. Gsoil 351]